MSKKCVIVTVIVLVVVLAGAGYAIYKLAGGSEENGGGAEGGGGETAKLLDEIRSETGIPFSTKHSSVFGWYVETAEGSESETAFGSIFEAEGVSSSKVDEIGDFLLSKGFEIDSLNIAEGTVTGSVGYKKGDVVCIVMRRSASENPEKVEVSCGDLPERAQ